MFSWAIAFFVIALIAAVFGFFGLAASAAGIAKIIFVVALILALVSFVAGRRPVVCRSPTVQTMPGLTGGRKV